MSTGNKKHTKHTKKAPLIDEPLPLDKKREIAEILAQETYPEVVPFIESSKQILSTMTPTASIAYKQLKIPMMCDEMYDHIKRHNIPILYAEIFKNIYDHMITFNFCPIELDRRRPNFYRDPDREIFKRLGIFVIVFEYFSGGVFLPTKLINIPNIYLLQWRPVITIGRDGTTNGKTNEINFFECLYIALRQYFANKELFINVPDPKQFIRPPRSSLFIIEHQPPIPKDPFLFTLLNPNDPLSIGGRKKTHKNQTKRNRKFKK